MGKNRSPKIAKAITFAKSLLGGLAWVLAVRDLTTVGNSDKPWWFCCASKTIQPVTFVPCPEAFCLRRPTCHCCLVSGRYLEEEAPLTTGFITQFLNHPMYECVCVFVHIRSRLNRNSSSRVLGSSLFVSACRIHFPLT